MTPHNRTTFSKFIIEDQHRRIGEERHLTDLTALLNDIQTACKFIALSLSRGSLDRPDDVAAEVNEIMLRECAHGGTLCGIASAYGQSPYRVPAASKRGPYLLAFTPLDGASNLDVNLTAGTIFSILRAPSEPQDEPAAGFVVPGWNQLAAGYALYGASSMLVVTLGAGVYGFTLDREIGAYTLTHPNVRIPEHASSFAINASEERFWEPPVRHYVDECIQGKSGPRRADFNMRWIASMVADVHRILLRGGLFIYPADCRLLYEANPLALIVEAAGGLASSGRQRILDIVPHDHSDRVSLLLGSRCEVERLVRYYQMYDRGEDLAFSTPLFNARSMFRSA